MSKPLRIVFDLDSIVADFFQVLLEDHNAATGEGLTPDHIVDWNMAKCSAHGKKIYEPFNKPGFFTRLPLIDGAYDAMQTLIVEDGNKAVIASHAVTPEAVAEKQQWVAKHLPFVDPKSVWLGQNKHDLHGHVLVDDGPHNARSFREEHPNAHIVTIAYAYNNVPEYDLRTGSWRDTRAAWEDIVRSIRALREQRETDLYSAR